MMRRIEVLRAKPQDFKGDRVNIHGKGGKWRNVPYARETREIIGEWLLEREAMIQKARKKNPRVKVPDALLIYERNGKLGAYHETGIDRIVANLRKRVEAKYARKFDSSNHTFRRTGGRMLWKAGGELEVIRDILGHKTVDMTIRYLGIRYSDMFEAMRKLDEFAKMLAARRKGTFAPEPEGEDGPKEIWTPDLPVISRALQPG